MRSLVLRRVFMACVSIGLVASSHVAQARDDWSGVYAGAHIGGLWTQNDANATAATIGYLPAIIAGAVPLEIENDSTGVMGGAQFGVNRLSGGFVVGIEGDISATDGSASNSINTNVGGGFVPVATNLSSDMSWLATLRLRIGALLSPNFLVYATGGMAVADVEHTMTQQGTPLTTGNFAASDSDLRAGWTIGGGGEWRWNANWSIKAEYLYYDLGKQTLSLTDPANFPGDFINYEVETTGHVARIGINYRFGTRSRSLK